MGEGEGGEGNGEREGQNDYLNELGEGKKAQNFSEKSTIYLKECRFSLMRNSGDLAPSFSTAEQCA